MLRKLVILVAILAVIGAAVFWIITMPASVSASALPAYTPNLENGKTMFYAGGCASCHATPKQEDKTRLGGGLGLKSPFGTFFTPNISPDPNDGIGAWSEANFVTAMWKGTSPSGEHYYPAFPYSPITTALVSVYCSRTSCPISRPQPDCLYPPKGASGSTLTPLMLTVPASSRDATWRARSGFDEKTYA